MNRTPEYEVKVELTDLIVALRCEADRADREGFPRVRDRQNALALHLENAMLHLNDIPHKGYTLRTAVTFTFTPSVNASLLPEFRTLHPAGGGD